MPDDPGPDDRAPFYGDLAPGWEFYRRTGARFTEEQHPTLVRSGGELPEVTHEAWHRFDKAHLVMLAECNAIPDEAAARNLQELKAMEAEGVVAVRRELDHLAHSGEAYLTRELSEGVAGWIHLGRSSVDLAAVARRIATREHVLDVLEATLEVIEAHCETARAYVDAPMPMYSRARHSQVCSFAYYLQAWARPLVRGIDRLVEAYRAVNRSPAGAAAGTATDVPIDRDRTARLLGFDDVAENAMDATRGDVDVLLDVLSELTTITGTVALAADHLVTWSGTEYELVDMPDRYYSTSSILAHKANPRALRHVQGTVRSTASDLMESYVGLGHEGGHAASPPTEIIEEVTTGLTLWAEVVRNLEFDRESAEERVYRGWGLVPDVAGQLVREAGINWRWAHQVMAITVRRAEERSLDIRDLTSEFIDQSAREYLGEPLGVDQAAIDEVVDAQRALRARDHVVGSPAPEQVLQGIEADLDAVTDVHETVDEFRRSLAEADQRLEGAVDDVIADAGLTA